MSKTESGHTPVKSSAEILLAEHNRLAALYLHNVEMGEKRTTLQVSLVSIGTAVLVALPKFDLERFGLWTSLGLTLGILFFGLLTFQRLLERRIRAIEYLRAINRIHRYFVIHDASLRTYLSWPVSDDDPPFHVGGTQLTGLRDIVACLNSLFAGIAGAEVFRLASKNVQISEQVALVMSVVLGLTIAAVVLLLHLKRETSVLGRKEREAAKDVKFPRDEEAS
jgi:hypothetical protein